MKTCIVDFSGREEIGNCFKIARYISESKINSKILRFNEFNIASCNHCNYECFRGECIHKDDLMNFYDSLMNFDELIFVIPVYCDFLCSNFMTFKERGQSFFTDENEELYLNKVRKYIIIGNSEPFLKETVCKIESIDGNQILQIKSKDYHVKSLKGDLIQHPEIQRIVNDFMNK